MNGLLILMQLLGASAPQQAARPVPPPAFTVAPQRDCRARPSDQRCRRLELQFRLLPESTPVDDPVSRAMRENWSRCGLSGMPVCPARGRLILRQAL